MWSIMIRSRIESNHVLFTCFHSKQKENTPSTSSSPKSSPNPPIADVEFAGRANDITGIKIMLMLVSE
ncbi:hypothetical protein H5410_043256 [Solanum commersonii]|uniref:Uncharacterized protein n=1 Tax=Solanum commersonii TaxID=4109 RepID=A0A9J5Y0W6_SOLCO|nr:hypothetical protein H5410_043256 [Solanum commersonii]